MSEARMGDRVDAMIRRLETPIQPAESFVSESLAELLPLARRARQVDRSPIRRLARDLTLVVRPGAWWASPRRASFAGILLLIALILVARLIVVVGSRRHLPPPIGPAGNGRIAFVQDGQVFTADPNGLDRLRLPLGSGAQTEPRFSPDGTHITYKQFAQSPNQGPADVVAADADGRNVVVIARAVAGLGHISWSPDSRDVLFAGSIDGGSDRGWIAPADGSLPPSSFTNVPGAWDPIMSPDGTRIAIGANTGLVVMNRDGSDARRVNQRDFNDIGNRGDIAEWSPDGTHLVFTAFTGDGNADFDQEVYIVGLDGQSERLLSPGVARAREAVWSPDGAKIAFMRSGTGLGPIVWIVDPAGRLLEGLPGYYGWYEPIWSPDGSKVVVTDDRPGPDNLDGPAVRVILDVEGKVPPVVIPAPGLTGDDVPDWAATWQRIALP